MEVVDDGVGPPSDIEDHGGFGLFSIRERVAQLGGWLDVEGGEGGGTRVRLVAPRDPARRSEWAEVSSGGEVEPGGGNR